MKYPVVNPHDYFIDYLTINYQIPLIYSKNEKELRETFPQYFGNSQKVVEKFEELDIEIKYLRNSKKSLNPSYTNSHRWLSSIYKDLKTYLNGFISNGFEFIKGVHVITDHKHHCLKIQFSGSFFVNNHQDFLDKDHIFPSPQTSTTNVFDDFKSIQFWHSEIDKFIRQHHKDWQNIKDQDSRWHTNFICNKELFCTLTRLDLACQSASFDSFKNCTTHSKNKNRYHDDGSIKYRGDMATYSVDETSGNRTGVTISLADEFGIPRRDVAVFFRAYDKRYTLDHDQLETARARFGHRQFIRKEWELKKEFLKSKACNIRSIEDLARKLDKDDPFYKPYYIENIIISMRLSKDLILYNDDKLYKALHDDNIKKQLHKNTLNGTTTHTTVSFSMFKRMFKTNYGVYLDRVPPQNNQNYTWDATKSMLGMAKTFNQDSDPKQIEGLIKFLKMKKRNCQIITKNNNSFNNDIKHNGELRRMKLQDTWNFDDNEPLIDKNTGIEFKI